MRKGAGLIFLAMVWVNSQAFGQCTPTQIFLQDLPNWNQTKNILDYVEAANPIPDWKFATNGTFHVIQAEPILNDLGSVLAGEDFLFTVRHYHNACTLTHLEGSANFGTLLEDQVVPVDMYTSDVTYRYSSISTGQAQITFELQDEGFTVFETAIFTLDVYELQDFTLTVLLDPGITGSPSSTSIYQEGTPVPYSYDTETCYQGLQLSLDSVPIPASGTILMDDNHTLQGIAELIVYDVSVTSTAGGHTNHDGTTAVDCGGNLTILATPDSGYTFVGWTGDVTSSQNPLNLNGIMQDYHIQANFTPTNLNLSVDRVEVIQCITMSASNRVYIADRPTIMRVFVGIIGSSSLDNVQGRLTRYVGSNPQDNILSSNGPLTMSNSPNEGIYNDTLNFTLPATWVQPNTFYVLELDPDNTVSEANEADNRYPSSGTQSFNFQVADPLNVMVVPINYQRNGTGSIASPNTSNLTYLQWMPPKVYPIATINYELHSPVSFTGDLREGSGWVALLNQVTAIHNTEEPSNKTKIYYGLVNFYDLDGCSGGCIAGYGWVASPTCVGFSGWGPGTNEASETFTHEAGHNFGRKHAPCGVSQDLDPSYPYTGGGIGVWGLDMDTLEIKDPSIFKDYMSYCNDVWTSDYTYAGIYNFRGTHTWKRAGLLKTDCFYLGGIVEYDNRCHMMPLNRLLASPDRGSDGEFLAEIFDLDNQIVFAQQFKGIDIGDNEGARGFGIYLPYDPSYRYLKLYSNGSLIWQSKDVKQSLVLSLEPTSFFTNGDALVRWRTNSAEAVSRVRLSKDNGITWEVLSIATLGHSVILESTIMKDSPSLQIEIQLTDGFRNETRTFRPW